MGPHFSSFFGPRRGRIVLAFHANKRTASNGKGAHKASNTGANDLFGCGNLGLASTRA